MTVEVKEISDDGDASQSEMDILNDETTDEVSKTDDSEGNSETEDKDEEITVDDPNDQDDEEEEEEEEESEEEVEEEEKPKKTSEFKEISQKYPKFFKEFPDVRKALITSKQYSELFDTVEDAQEISQKSQVFDLLSNALLNDGNPTPLIENLAKSSSKENFAKFAESILPAIHKQDPESYIKITVPVVKRILRAALNDGRSTNSKNLENSAKVLSQYLFGSTDINILNDEPKAEVKPDKEKEDLKNRLVQNLQAQEAKFIDNVKNITEVSLVRQIEKYIKTTDKGNNINKFTKQAIIKEALSKLDRLLVQDKEHMRTMGRLREQAARSNFAGTWEPRVSTAYLGRATNLLNGIQRQLVAEALGTKPQNTRTVSSSSSVKSNNGHVPNDPKKVFRGDPKKRMTDREFIDAD